MIPCYALTGRIQHSMLLHFDSSNLYLLLCDIMIYILAISFIYLVLVTKLDNKPHI